MSDGGEEKRWSWFGNGWLLSTDSPGCILTRAAWLSGIMQITHTGATTYAHLHTPTNTCSLWLASCCSLSLSLSWSHQGHPLHSLRGEARRGKERQWKVDTLWKSEEGGTGAERGGGREEREKEGGKKQRVSFRLLQGNGDEMLMCLLVMHCSKMQEEREREKQGRGGGWGLEVRKTGWRERNRQEMMLMMQHDDVCINWYWCRWWIYNDDISTEFQGKQLWSSNNAELQTLAFILWTYLNCLKGLLSPSQINVLYNYHNIF